MKNRVISEIETYLREELAGTQDPARASELSRLLDVYRFIPRRDHAATDPIVASSLVELETGTTITYAFVAPSGGGLVLRVDGKPVQVLTAQSPLGEALIGRRAGESVQIHVAGQARSYQILSVR